MATKTYFYVKLRVGLCLCLGIAGSLLAQPALIVTISGTLGPYISGSGEITSATYVSGITATGTTGEYCLISFNGGSTAATAKVLLSAANKPSVGNIPSTNFLSLGSGYSYTNPPTSATVISGGTAICNVGGTAVVTAKIDDPLSLNGQAFTAATTLSPVGVIYNGSSITYPNLPLTLSAAGFNLNCQAPGATAVVTVNDASVGGNDSLSVSNCILSGLLTGTFVAKLTFPAGTIAAPVPLTFGANVIASESSGTYTPTSGTYANDSTKLGGSGTISALCSGCPTESLSPAGPLAFTATAGGSPPAAQSVTVNSSPVENEAYAVTTSASWLTVNGASTTGGQIGGSFNVDVNPASLAAGPYTGTVCVYTAASNSSASSTPCVTVNLTVTAPSPPTITTTSLPNGEVGLVYNQTLHATGGTPPYGNWTVSTGSLPAGLSLNSSTGVISGTPATAGSSPFSVTVKDSAGHTSAAQPLSITIVAGVTITTTSLPGGMIGVAYSQTLAATGGTQPYGNWTVVSGSLPGGLTLNSSSGAISGTPNTAGPFTFSVTVRDSAGSTSPAANLSITITAGVTITTTSLANGEVGVGYSQALAAIGGTPPYSNWTVSSGSLPAGLSLNSSTGAISGTPTAAGTASFSVTVKDSAGHTSAAQPLSITIIAGVTVTTASLPNGEVGVAYSQTLAATGGTQPYGNWTLASGSLPAGLTLNASTGAISGAPTAAGTVSFSVTVKDSAGDVSPAKSLSITIIAGVTITTTSLPGGTVGVAYSQALAATGGTQPYSNWTVASGSLPNGLTLNSSTGVIGGSPTTAGTASFSVTVKDNAGGVSPAKSLSIIIVAPLTITTSSLPNGTVGVAYSQALLAVGGTPPYSNWTVASGALPAGLSLNSSTGVIAGTPTTAGSPSFSVTVKDTAGLTAPPRSLSITINPGVTITTTSLANGAVGAVYSATLAATGGTPPYSNWTIATGSLPASLSLNASTGVISGTPTTAGSSPFSVTVKDSAGSTSPAQSLSISIVSGLTITTTSLPNGTVGAVYSQILAAAGGTPPYSNWTVTVGSLPAGLSLNASSGAIGGTPITAGSSSFSVTVKDSANTTSPAQQLSITIVNGVTITTTSLPNGTTGVSYSQTLAAAGGTPPYGNWTVSSGSLPAGLSLNVSSGVIGGTPTNAGNSSFSVTVKDSAGNTSPAKALSIAIVAPLTITTTSLPNGTTGVSYSQTLAATGGLSPYSNWTVSSGSLPAGLSLNSSSGMIGGTPATAGSSSFSVTVKDSAGNTSPAQALSITIVAPLTITTASLPNGALGVSYSQTLAATGGVPPYSNWTVSSGSLPAGLSLNSSSGAVGGTPTTAGNSSFSVTVKDSAGNTSPARALSIAITAGVTITTTSLPGGAAGVAYSQMLAAAGGTPPYSNWTVITGSLPNGLTLNSATGAIGGTPTTGGTYSFSVTVKDSANTTSPAQALSITIVTPLTITTASLPSGVLGGAYSQTLVATGGTPPYKNWTVTSGSLPPGLTLNAAAGVISGTVTTATGSPFTFSVTVSDSANSTSPPKVLSITIGAAQLKIGSPSYYLFSLANTSAPAAGAVTIIASDGSAQPFTVTAAPTNFNWLTFSPTSGVTPATITLKANPAGLIPGIYPSPLVVKSGSLSLTVQAQLTITGSNLAASPSLLTFTYQPGLPLPAAQTVSLTVVSGGSVALSSVTTDVSWLNVSQASIAPAMLQVSINPGLLSAGTYTGDVVVKGVGSPDASLEIPVTITVNPAPQITATPATLAFNYQIGGAAPAPQSFAVGSGNVTVNFTATSPGNWLQVSPQHGTTPGSVLVTANPAGLPAGTYGGTIKVTIIGAASSTTVAVTLTIAGPPQIGIAPSQLTFVAPVGGPAPAPQTLTLTSASGPLAFTAGAGSTWLGVTPTSGTTPAPLTVSVNPAGLANGTYNGMINITQAGSAVPQMVPVTLQVGNVTPTIAGVINAASGAIGTVAPGMAISIFGSALGPQTGVGFTAPAEGGTVATTLAGTQVLFDGTPAPVLFTLTGQVNALAPFELSNKAKTVMQVVYNGVTSTGTTLPVVAAEPGLFTLDGTGKGQGAILNQDFSVNNASNPAAAGTIIQLFGTGGGVTNPPSTDGALNPISSTGKLTLAVTATVGGQPAQVDYAGPAPGLVAGVLQINVTLPSGTPSGNVPVVVTETCPQVSSLNNCSAGASQAVTVAVQ